MNRVARQALVPTMAVLNGVLLLVVALALAGYWLLVLGPFIRRGETSRAELLASAHAGILEASLESGDLSQVDHTLGQMVLLNDAETRQPFVLRVELTRPNGDVLRAQSSGDATGTAVPVQVMLFSPTTFGPVGVLSVSYSGFFYEQAKADALQGLAIAVMAPIVFVALGNMVAGYLLQLRIRELRNREEASARQHAAELERRVEERTAALSAANRELESFTYTVSHDLRAPLRALAGYTRVLVEGSGPALAADGRHAADVVQSEARRMGELIDALLAFAHLGRAEVRRSPIDMRALAESAWEAVASAAGPGERIFTVDDLPQARGEPAMIRQVWRNLLENAVKFTGGRTPARIGVGARGTDGETAYYVRDNGVGFDMRYSEKLFQVFQRLQSESAFPGTGVGLAIVRRIVERHGGRVWAEGRMDAGATFYFTLPAGKETGDERPA